MTGLIGYGRATKAARRGGATEAARRAPGNSAALRFAGHLSSAALRFPMYMYMYMDLLVISLPSPPDVTPLLCHLRRPTDGVHMHS